MKQLLFALLVIACFACNKTKGPDAPTVNHIRVDNNASAALTASVSFSTSELTDASVVYHEKGSTEERISAISRGNRDHRIALLPLKENTVYVFTLKMKRNEDEFSSGPQEFRTAAIPDAVKEFYKPSGNRIDEPEGWHFLFTSRVAPACTYILNNKGELVWYRTTNNMLKVVRFTQRNTLLCLEDENNTVFGDGNVILELSLSGDTLFYARHGSKGFDKLVHHDLCLNHRGNIVGVTNVYRPGTTIPGDGLIEFDRNGNKRWEWTTFDTPDAAETGIGNQPWINSLVQDKDNNYIISLRSFSQVWKINSESGAVMWKLGKGGNIQMDQADEFMFQHYAHRNPAGDIMLFDNGAAERPVSRLLSFSIDEQEKKATRKIFTELPSSLYSNIMGSTMLMPDQGLLTASATNGRIVKTNAAGTVLWTIKVAEPIYRAEYIGNPF